MKDRQISITLNDQYEFRQGFKSLKSLIKFITNERDFWLNEYKRIEENTNERHPALNVHGTFESALKTIDNWKEPISDWSDEHLNKEIQLLFRNSFSQLSKTWLWSGSEFVEQFLMILIEHNTKTASSFIDYITKKSVVINNNNIDCLNGALLAYEFTTQSSDLTKRRTSEKKSLGLLRNNYTKAQNELFAEVDEIKSGIHEWNTDNKIKFSNLYEEHDKNFDDQLRTWSSTIYELEKTYEEKLRLKKPAGYWNTAAKKYGFQGGLWTLAIIALVIVGLIYFREFFLTWLSGQETGIKLSTIQGAILFGAFAAVYAYLLRVISRLAFSAFHLMRDAEEREQLTYLYLSLSNESAVDKDSRDIILQALFSRSETGLLAAESGPTMPVADAFKAATKGAK
ncbi:DUF6161 domain-containing protein [Aliikangiella sp. IMCC44632]